MIDERTPKRGFALPYVSNSLKEDVARLRETITALDEVLMDGDLPTSYDAENITYTPQGGQQTSVKAKLDLLSDAKNINYSPAAGGNKTVAATFDEVNGYLQKISNSFTSTPATSGVDPRIIAPGNVNIQQIVPSNGSGNGTIRVRFLNSAGTEVAAILCDGTNGRLQLFSTDPTGLSANLVLGSGSQPITQLGVSKTINSTAKVQLRGASVVPQFDQAATLGGSATDERWSTVYATTGAINTSDERAKQEIGTIPDEVLDAWSEVEYVQFRFVDAVAEKGGDARLHTGVVAQRVKEAFERHGIDPFAYGVLCYDEWDAVEEEKDSQGEILIPALEAGNIYAIRYDEANALEAALNRREMKKIKAALGLS